jgi:hypothetical protein
MVVIVRKRVVDVGNVEVEPLGNSRWILATILDEGRLAEIGSLGLLATVDPLLVPTAVSQNSRLAVSPRNSPTSRTNSSMSTRTDLISTRNSMPESAPACVPQRRRYRVTATLSCRQRQRTSMGTKQVRVSEHLYARIQSENREGETLGETLERLVDDSSLLDFADDAADLDLDGSVREATDGAVEAPRPPE